MIAGMSGAKISASAVMMLKHVLVFLSRLLYGVLRYALNPCRFYKIIIKVSNRIPDDHLELSGLCKASFYHLHCLDRLHIRLLRIYQGKPHPRHTVRNSGNVFFSAYQTQQFFCIF